MKKQSTYKHSLITLLSAAIASAAFAGGAAAQSTPTVSNRSPASTQTYWTAEKMATATPVDNKSTAAAGPARAIAPAATGTPGAAGGSFPGGQLLPQDAALPLLQQASGEVPIPADGAYPGPHNTFEWGPKYRTFPISTIGKLFFTEPGVGNFVCSAAVTTGSSSIKNVIWTAGHCVANGGHSAFYTNWLFCPSYDSSQGGANPALGCWSWATATTSNEWFKSGAFTRDYAIITLSHTGTVLSTDVANATGSLGLAWNFSRDQHWFHAGYPSAAPYTGGKLIMTATEHRYDDTPDALGPKTNSWGSAQTPGASGSPVILGFSFGGGFINSDVSYYYLSQAGKELQGPYFDTQVCNFWKSNTGYTGSC